MAWHWAPTRWCWASNGSSHSVPSTGIFGALHAQLGIRVAVVNSEHLTNLGYCQASDVTTDGEAFSIGYYGLALGTYQMVLGVQWLESLGPIHWDFRRRMLAFVWNGHQVLWMAAAMPKTQLSILAQSMRIMDDLLLAFDKVFVEPTGLPLPL
jgi:hypothetical protein